MNGNNGNRIRFQPKWRKVAYGGRQPGYDDNYTDESFLEEMVTNANVVKRDLLKVIVDSVSISQYLCIVALVVSTWTLTLNMVIDEAALLKLDVGLLLVGFSVLFLTTCPFSAQLLSKYVLNISFFISGLYVLAPIYHTLTRSISSDSIWALAVALLLVHLFLHDYSGSTIRPPGALNNPKLTSNISLNASIVASVLVASRLPSRLHVFAIMLFSLQGDSMDWNDENIAHVCKLFAQQVLRGNRPNTHLNAVGYDEVIAMFKQITGIELTRRQLKNKWDKLKPDYTAWQKLMRRQTGTGFDSARGVIVMDDEWWKKARKEIPGCGKFRKKPLQNLEELKVMFSDIVSDESDHWNPMSQNPIIPEETQGGFGVDDEEIEDGQMAEDADVVPLDENNEADADADEVLEISPSLGNAKRRARVVVDKGKKQKTKTALVIQEQITKIAESASSFTSKKSSEVTVQQIMELVLDCGADYGTDEHYIATELFVKKDQRDMFLTLPTREIRFNWLRRKYHGKYGN